jgi:hypothetical protein
MTNERKSPPTEASGQGTVRDSIGFIAVALLLASAGVAWLWMVWG